MKSKILSIFAIAPLLMACNTSVPSKGYAKFKSWVKSQVSGDIKYINCSYAFIEKAPGYPTLNETCYYLTNFSVNSEPYHSYYVYKNSDDSLIFDMDPEGYMYSLAVDIVKSDPSVGKTGTL